MISSSFSVMFCFLSWFFFGGGGGGGGEEVSLSVFIFCLLVSHC